MGKIKQTVGINPLADRVLVKQDEPEEKTLGGIYLAESEKIVPTTGIVVAKGPGITGPVKLDVGDHVYYGKYGGQEVTLDGDTYLSMREGDIIGVLTK